MQSPFQHKTQPEDKTSMWSSPVSMRGVEGLWA